MKDLCQHFSTVLNNSSRKKDRLTLLQFVHFVLSLLKNLLEIPEMKFALFLYTESDSTKAEELKDYLQANLPRMADFRSIVDVLVAKRKLKDELPRSDCIVLIVSREASSLIHNKRAEIEDGFETFDGKLFHKEFTENKDLLKRLIIVFFTERTENDWIPADFDERRIFYLECEKIQGLNPVILQLRHCVRVMLSGEE